VTLRLRFEVQVPSPSPASGHVGDSYSMGQWYPKFRSTTTWGWHADPFHYFSEFYGDYGTFDVAITLPDRFWVGATGVLQGAVGGDNEIPLRGTARFAADSVTIHLRAVPGDSLRGRWPRAMLSLETDLAGSRSGTRSGSGKGGRLEVKAREGSPVARRPAEQPVHYSYLWIESGEESRPRGGTPREGPGRSAWFSHPATRRWWTAYAR